MTPYKEEFTSGTIHQITTAKGITYFDVLWSSNLFTSKRALRKLFEQGAIERI